jgi:hypothetical protein
MEVPVPSGMEANTMIEMTTAASLYTNNSLGRTQGAGSFYYEESGQLTTAETFTFSGDQVSLSYRSESVTTYNSSMTMEGVLTDAYDLLRGLVLNIFEKQGIDSTFTAGETEVDLSTLSQEEAQELVADDGYFGVEKTSDRIFNFAVGIAGGDPSRIDAIREGVQQGFDEALDAFGGWLPDISYDTYDAVMNKLDEWVAQA